MRNFDLQEELQGYNDLETYDIPNGRDVSALRPAEVNHLLSEAVDDISNNSEAILNDDTFDIYRSLLKYTGSLSGDNVSKLLDALISGFQAQTDAAILDVDNDNSDTFDNHKIGVEKYAFLLNWFISTSEKVKAPGEGEAGSVVAPTGKGRRGRGGKAAAASRRASEWTWEDQIAPTLGLIGKVLAKLKIAKIWKTTPEKDALVRCLTGPAYRVAEKETYMKSIDIRLPVYRVICLAVKFHGHSFAAQASIMQGLQFFEHLAEPMAELVSKLATEFDHAQLGDGLVKEIASKNFSAQDSKGPRVFSKFLVKYTEEAPKSVLKQLSLLKGQFDSESYPMRIAMVEIVGIFIRELAGTRDTVDDLERVDKQIVEFFDTLITRSLDLSSYVRTKVFGVLHKLCDISSDKAPWVAITKTALDSLEDKVASVRKSAIALLSRLIERHPYWRVMSQAEIQVPLKRSEWQKLYDGFDAEHKKKEKELEALALNVQGQASTSGGDGAEEDDSSSSTPTVKPGAEDAMDVDEEEADGGEDEEQEEDMENDEGEDGIPMPKKKKGKKPKTQTAVNLAALGANGAISDLDAKVLEKLDKTRTLCSVALKFIGLVERGSDIVARLLGSTHKAEVLEAMEFFRILHVWEIETAEVGIKRMLHLIWAKDNSLTSEDGKELKGVRSRLLECYRQIYFDPLADPNMSGKQQVNRITKNMIELTKDASLAELTSLEEMMRIMMEDDQIHGDIVNRLWQVYSSEKPLPKFQRRGAIITLGMLALARRSVVTERVETLIKVGLGPLGKADLILAKYTCVALQRMNGSAKKVKGSLLDKNVRYDMNNLIFHKLQDAIEHPCHSIDWFGMSEQAINTIYALGDHPDVLCDNLIRNLTRRAFARNPNAASQSQQSRDEDAMDEDAPGPSQTSQNGFASTQPESQAGTSHSGDVGDAFQLAQMIFVVGHVAIKHIVYLELVEREWKRQKNEREAAEKAKAANASKKDGDDLEAVVGNAEDEIGDRIAAVRETELLYGPESLLAVYGDMAAHIAGSGKFGKNRILHTAATLTLSKFLCISSQFCDQYHRLLFKILELSDDPTICSNVVIALGDVAVSFSTIVDENSNELYRGLSNKNLIVKKNTLMVLTHLILNGMIKVKGQLGEMAKCLEDDDPRIADLAKLFFTELSTKDNAIYNNLPDVISHLSVGDHAVDEEAFQSTMKYIFSFIEKEKQAESIVEKLCQRFRLSEDPRQWRDIAFCLSLLPFKSERSVKKLIEGLQFYRDKLHEETVYARFQEILAKARANKSANKPDSELNEFENILEEHKRQGEEDHEFEKRVAGKKKAAAKKRSTRAPAKRKEKPLKQVQEEDEEDE